MDQNASPRALNNHHPEIQKCFTWDRDFMKGQLEVLDLVNDTKTLQHTTVADLSKKRRWPWAQLCLLWATVWTSPGLCTHSRYWDDLSLVSSEPPLCLKTPQSFVHMYKDRPTTKKPLGFKWDTAFQCLSSYPCGSQRFHPSLLRHFFTVHLQLLNWSSRYQGASVAQEINIKRTAEKQTYQDSIASPLPRPLPDKLSGVLDSQFPVP
ncbi:hypothetical protein llap_2041 [Limosa lapponica baueri]|uniref:Uncharacterized protein n=1 Tax=Limosa lapponica baueri TaxID=1758121 RepID=A0A2I0UNL9_LIMLA|nr:hypothetical protein llap_2041 [Limosa lapponica baueri]